MTNRELMKSSDEEMDNGITGMAALIIKMAGGKLSDDKFDEFKEIVKMWLDSEKEIKDESSRNV